MTVRVVRSVAPRTIRSPVHTAYVEARPFVLQPFLLAPVRPGETVKAGMFQVRALSDPVKSPVVGAWLEVFLFYVRASDLDDSAALKAVFVNPSANLSAYYGPASRYTYHAGSAVDWARRCLDVVVRTHFRREEEDETLAAGKTAGGEYLAAVHGRSWLDSLYAASELAAATGSDDFEKRWSLFRQMRERKLVTGSYEEFLEEYGVTGPSGDVALPADLRIPELVRFVRTFAYPALTVDPASGSPAALWSWTLDERVRKARFCDEWGFLFGVLLVRPKTYFKNQKGAAAWFLSDPRGWVPDVLEDAGAVQEAIFNQTSGAGPLNVGTTGYVVDVRDLFLHGDQWTNVDLTTTTDPHFVPLPSSDATNSLYPTEAAIDAFFVGTSKRVRIDAVAQFNIAGNLRDHTV